MKKNSLILAVLFLGFGLIQAQPALSLLPPIEEAQCNQWVEQTLANMTFDEKIGQLFICTIDPKLDKKGRKQMHLLAKKYAIGGLLYSQGNADEQVELTNLAQQCARIPLLITFDGEWGLATRLADALHFPKNAALGCIANNHLIEAYGREVARELQQIGVQVNFAPVADVNTNPKNPAIHVRSFGADSKAVAEKVLAYSRGLESGGVLAVAKHFPGLGDAYVDSYKAFPRIYYHRQHLDSIELYPFRHVIDAGIGGIMVGHLLVPALERDGITPASLSRSIVTDLLRTELRFQGLVFADALTVPSLANEPHVTVRALRAGSDLVLVRQDIDWAMQSVRNALQSGELTHEEVDAKCRRILTYKFRLGLNRHPIIDTSQLVNRLHNVEGQALASQLRLAAITVLRNTFHLLPFPTDAPLTLLSLGDEGTDQPFITRFTHYASAECFRLNRQTPVTEQQQMAEKLRTCHRLLISITADEQELLHYRPFFNRLAELEAEPENKSMPPIAYAFFTSFRALNLLEVSLRSSAAIILAHSAESDIQHHVADLAFAKVTATGRLAMPIGTLFNIGEGTDLVPGTSGGPQPEDYGLKGYILSRIDSVAQAGLAAGAYPGCQILVLKDGQPVYNKCFGAQTDTDTLPLRPTELFDLGDLTKITATLLAVMKLYDQGKLQLTDPAANYLPWFRTTDKRGITIRELLLHESGLMPYIRFYREAIDENTVTGPFAQGFVDEWHQTRMGQHTYACSDFKFKRGLTSPCGTTTHTLQVADGLWLAGSFKQTILQSIARSALGPKRFVYSDLGFIVLQQVVEAIVRQPMDEFLAQEFYMPAGLNHTLFKPLSRYPLSDIMPTATNDYLRRQNLHGYVYDETTAFLGGVSGSSGLFSTATEVGQLYQLLLNGGELNGRRYLSEATCRLFIGEHSAISHRGLGFDKPNRLDPKASECTPLAPVEVFGHTGVTGTCAWADPINGLVYVFLSNRLCPDAWDGKLNDRRIRQAIQQIIYERK